MPGHGNILIQDPVEWSHPLNQGLVSWWLALPSLPRGLRWHDLTRRNHGTLTNGPTWQGARGRPGGWGALSLDGSDDRITHATPTLGTVYTLAFWFQYDDAGDGVVIGGSSTTVHYGLYVDGPGGGGAFYHRSGGALAGPEYATVGHGGLTAGRWCHVAMARSGASVAFYKDGASLGTGTLSGGAESTALAVNTIGSFSDGSLPTTFLIDDYRLCTRNLSAADVAALYAESKQGYPALLKRVRRAAVKAPAAPGGGVPLGTLALLGCGR